jgi:hypothetical protein
MRNSTKFLIICTLGLLSFWGCIKEIDYGTNTTASDKLVVSGRLTNLPERQIIRLLIPGDYQFQNFIPIRDAVITLKDDLGATWQYQQETRPDTIHTYFLDNFQGVPGRSYSIQIQLARGGTYETKPQLMPEPITMDSMNVVGQYEEKVTPTGIFVQKRVAASHIQTTIPASTNRDLALHWDVYQVWLFQEFKTQMFPPDPWVSCFITDYFNRQNIDVVRIRDLQPGATIRQEIGSTGISYAFETRTSFTATQFVTNKDAARYLEQSEQLLAQSGSIFDVPPAPVRGNVYDVNQPTELALGYFEVAAASVKRAFVNNGQLGPNFQYLDSYCYPTEGNLEFSKRVHCESCHLLPNSTVERPVWWQ